MKESNFYDEIVSVLCGDCVEGRYYYASLYQEKKSFFEKKMEIFGQKNVFQEYFFDRIYDFFQNHVKKIDYKDDFYYVGKVLALKSEEVEVDGIRFFFDVSDTDLPRNHSKKDLFARFREEKDGRMIFDIVPVFTADYSNAASRALKVFKRRIKEIDFLVCKDMEKFLREKLDFFLYKIFKESWDSEKIVELKKLESLILEIIQFVAEMENIIWEEYSRPKEEKDVNYVVSLDLLSDEIVKKFLNIPI